MGQMLDSRGKGAHAQGCKDFKSDRGRSGTFDCTVVGERERERERQESVCVCASERERVESPGDSSRRYQQSLLEAHNKSRPLIEGVVLQVRYTVRSVYIGSTHDN